MKRIIPLLLCLFLLLPLPVSAAVFQDVQYVVDQAGLLTDTENTALDNMAETLSEKHGVDVLIAIVDSLEGETAEGYAISLNGSRNWWNTDHAVLYLLAMEEREWYIATFGDGISLLSDSALDQLGYGTASYFSEGLWYEGFEYYLEDLLPAYLDAGRQYSPASPYTNSYEYYETPTPHTSRIQSSLLSVLPLSALIGLVAATITILIMRHSMNTKRRQRSAGDYLTRGSYHLHRHQDIFLYSNVSKVRRQQNTSSGSSVHRSSGSRSYGGRGGKF